MTSARSRYEIHLSSRVPKGDTASPELARAFGLDDERTRSLGAFGEPSSRQ